ncbi:hypothetical protein BMW24_016775 [Mycobacterium heckeshornense]|uniref:Integral membrane protein n=2 Tax=Mycobacterium heckeshornense TaxID=110505 RepID=A0A2G8B5X7_9MYCO|nr:hypothetical protein [Mycobacterium heckeshornense]MCV7033975.1 hypothetical protein [Mycobacterium heckeshornense]PIJ33185.1 hypothetical protein BMW24_016775 [Mycobacterium heckeshornense]BCO37217.1 integral membrane protein [Mycobacterium heckeshornense]
MMIMVDRVFSAAFGLLMVAAAAAGTQGPALVVAVVAVVAVLGGTVFRPVATLAVLLTVVVAVLTAPSYVMVAVSGLSATAYLLLRYATRPATAAMIVTPPTVIAALGFTFVGLAATSFPLQLPWLPVLAPLAAFAIYVLATRPFVR